MARQDLREVVLVEEDDLGTGADDVVGGRGGALRVDTLGGDPGDPGDAAAGRPRRAPVRLGRRGLVALGTLAVVVATAGVVDGVRERAEAARLAGVEGLLTSLGPDVQELWRHPAGWGQMATIGGDLVIGRTDDAGVDELVGVDAETGRDLWVAPVPELTETGEIWCETFGDAELGLTTHVACRVIGAQSREILGRRIDVPPDEGALLVVIDTRTGERVVERTLDTRYPTLESLGDDLVLVELPDDGHVRVTRMDPVTSAERWTFRSAEPLPTTGRLRETPVPLLQHGVLVLTGATGWALSLDGEQLGEWDLRGTQLLGLGGGLTAGSLTALPDGRFAVAAPGAAGARADRFGTISATDDRDGFAIPGPVLETVVDDGSAADVVLTSQAVRGRLTAQDATTGERLWTYEPGVHGDAVLLDRRLVAVSEGAVVALDVRTGELLWSTTLGGRRAPRLMTDGRVVVAGLRGPGDERALVAWGVDDGRERWRAPLPRDAVALQEVAGRLFGFSDEHVIGFGRVDRGGGPGRSGGEPPAQAGPAAATRLP